ncbi:MAG TPA: VRR-NUC domain-containing protein [Desulfosporosinus sp.]|nr:VRR-NUC domain-containing protein [Desulfosporosinus sp.]
MKHAESDNQIALFQWTKLAQAKYPELVLLHAIGNGNARTNVIQGARMKREGVLAGVSDIMLPVSRNGYHGLYIELKVKGNTTSASQKWWIEQTTKQGYLAKVCYGWIEAKEVLEGYLGNGGS